MISRQQCLRNRAKTIKQTWQHVQVTTLLLLLVVTVQITLSVTTIVMLKKRN